MHMDSAHFHFKKTVSSTLPPLLNAMEVYMVNSLSQNETDTKEGYINNYNFLNKLFLCLIVDLDQKNILT